MSSFAGGYHAAVGGGLALTLQRQDAMKQASAPQGLQIGRDFPMVCEVCLGPNPYVRMIREKNAAQCKISDRPFTVFRWKAGPGGRYKSTIVCYDVAKAKNICQACLVDMEFGVPVGVRDALLSDASSAGSAIAVPSSGVNMNFYFQQQAQLQAQGDGGGSASSGRTGKAASRALLRVARQFNRPYDSSNRIAFRNLPKLCSFWVNGTCSRVVQKVCQFRPCCGIFKFPELASSYREINQRLIDALRADGALKVMKTMGPEIRRALKESVKGSRIDSIRNRYNGVDDELSAKYVARAKAFRKLEVPEDDSITTLFVGGLDDRVSRQDLQDAFYAHGEIRSINIRPAHNCAFVEFTTRAAAQHAADAQYGRLQIHGIKLAINWARGGHGRSSCASSSSASGVAASSSARMALPGLRAVHAGGIVPSVPNGFKAAASSEARPLVGSVPPHPPPRARASSNPSQDTR